MNATTELREHLGISQQSLASYLQVHRSQLNMYEMNKRDLPAEANLKLVPMIECMYATIVENAKGETNTVPAEPIGAKKDLLNEAIGYDIQAHKLRKQLEGLQRNYALSLNIKAMALHLVEKGTTTDASRERDTAWIEYLRRKGELGILSFGPAAQLPLQWKLDCAEYAARRARELAERK